MNSTEKDMEAFAQQLKNGCKAHKFDIKGVETFGSFRVIELESLKHIKIREECLKELLTKSLKVSYLLDPVLKSAQQVENSLNQDHHSSPSTLFKLNSILKILCENMFYLHMNKLQLSFPNSAITLVNNRSTQLNVRVVIAALIVFVSKRLTLQQIGTAMLIFNLQETLLNLRPYGLPLDHHLLQKCLKKLGRIINMNDLKNFICAVREEQKIQSHSNDNDLNRKNLAQLCIGPDKFLFLYSLSQKKQNLANSIFLNAYLNGQRQSNLHKQNFSKLYDIDPFIKQNKVDVEDELEQFKDQQDELQSQNRSLSLDYDNSIVNGNKIAKADKIEGLSIENSEVNPKKTPQYFSQIYKEIKKHIYYHNSKTLDCKVKKSLSLKLKTQIAQNNQRQSFIFKQGMKTIKENQTKYLKIFQNVKQIKLEKEVDQAKFKYHEAQQLNFPYFHSKCGRSSSLVQFYHQKTYEIMNYVKKLNASKDTKIIHKTTPPNDLINNYQSKISSNKLLVKKSSLMNIQNIKIQKQYFAKKCLKPKTLKIYKNDKGVCIRQPVVVKNNSE